MKNVGIIGQGFVGNAVFEGLKNFYSLHTLDTDPSKRSSCQSILELADLVDQVCFVCLPTPMEKSGECNVELVKNTLMRLEESAKILDKNIIAIIKSTVPPGTTSSFNDFLNRVTCVFSPEFLTEANSVDDFKNQNRIIVGGPRPASTTVKRMMSKAFPKVPIIKTSSSIAETVKYFTNCFLATKVSFANEMKQICDGMDIDFDKVVEYALYDERIGKSHLSVPGPDGSMGFGGHCFPKDLNAIIFFAKNLEINPTMMSAVWEKNLDVRPQAERDWENMVGRAVLEDT